MKYSIRGFTLLEIMIVVAILGLLTAIATPGVIKARSRAREGHCQNNMRTIAHAVEQYTIEYNIATNTTINIYDDVIMPATDDRIPELYIPKYLRCPEADMTYGTAGVNNSNMNVTCPVTAADKSHGTYGDII